MMRLLFTAMRRAARIGYSVVTSGQQFTSYSMGSTSLWQILKLLRVSENKAHIMLNAYGRAMQLSQ